MSLSIQRLSAPKAPLSANNSHRAERGAVAFLGTASIWQGIRGLAGDFKGWKETTTVSTTSLRETHFIASTKAIDAEVVAKMSEDQKKALIDVNGTRYEVDNTTGHLLEKGTEVQEIISKAPATKKENYLRLASVVMHGGEVVLGLAALNASRK